MSRKEIDKEVLQEVKLYQSQDYEIVDQTPEYFKLRRSNATAGGHIVIFLFTVWFTFGIGNLIYWLINVKHKKVFK